jgi:CRISPR-associated protein Cst1
MQVYYFSNYGQGPELEIFYLPANVFRFLRYAYQAEFKADWNQIVRSGYQRVKWDKVTSEEDYKNYTNLVYEYLLTDRSILGFFLNRKARKPRGNWELLSLYMKEVRKVKAERLEAIKQVGDCIAESIRKSERDRRLRQLESAKSYRECRNILRFVIRDRIAQREDEPLFTLDDYVSYLFPDTDDSFTQWSETRDLLVFRVYEKLHDWLRDKGFVEKDEDEITEPPEEAKED